MGDFENFKLEISQISDLEAFWERVNIELARFGVTSIMYGAIATRSELILGARTESMIWKTNHGSEFFERFCTPGRDDSIDNCLTFEHCLNNTYPFIWHDYSMWEGASKLQMAHALAARELGLFVGFTLPTTYFSDQCLGAISVSVGKHTPESFDVMWQNDKDELFSVLGVLDSGMRQKYIAEVIGLAPREKETIEWLAAGLRPVNVAEKMGIGFRTVDKYINSARKKLKSRSRDQAVAKALIFKVIS